MSESTQGQPTESYEQPPLPIPEFDESAESASEAEAEDTAEGE